MTYVFDLDGTIVDSRKRHFYLMANILKENNIKVEDDFELSFMRYKADGRTGLDFLVNVLKIDEDKARSIQNAWISHIEDNEWLKYDSLYSDVMKTFKTIKNNNGTIYILSLRNNQENAENEIKNLGLMPIIDKAYFFSHSQRKADFMKTIHDKSIMVGDTEIDYEAAIEAGCEYYILNRGFRSESFWTQKGVQSFKDLSELC